MRAQILFEFLIMLAVAVAFSLLVLSISIAYEAHLSNESGMLSNSISKSSLILNGTLPQSGNLRVIVSG